jgi:VWFA-related protein
MDAIQTTQMDFNIFTINTRDPSRTPLESPSGSVSKLDLKAPGKAQREYQKAYQLLQRKDLQGAVEHLLNSIHIYPSFVAAHNALGTAYLDLNQNDEARDEFGRAVALDDHLPNSYLNLGVAELVLKQYTAAEQSLRKASSIAPLDLQLSVALAYGEFVNGDYPAVLAIANEVHARKHKGAELVHYFAAGAWEAQDNLIEAQHEMETLLQEAPSSSSAGLFRQILAQIITDQALQKAAKLSAPQKVTFSFSVPSASDPHEALQAQQVLQDAKVRSQIAEAEAGPGAVCVTCRSSIANESDVVQNSTPRTKRANSGFVLRSAVDEVDVFFAATDHGNSVLDLTPANIRLRDDGRPPDRMIGFRNESQLPLRLGIVIDTSGSVADRLSFEQKAATKFLDGVLKDSRDLSFVVGVNNSVLLVQDFTPDGARTSRAINQLAPGGGTALWDAVAFASKKLAGRAEAQPVARVLVVISDGQDNSSGVTLKEAAEGALRDEVVVYTVSTRDLLDETSSSLLGDHALKTISDLTGGATFVPGSLHRLDGSLRDVQQVIRGRYLVAYKPASFESDGRYRTIQLTAEREGHQFKVFARKGYYASAGQSEPVGR